MAGRISTEVFENEKPPLVISASAINNDIDKGDLLYDTLSPEQLHVEKAMVRKFDLYLIPVLAIMYLFKYV